MGGGRVQRSRACYQGLDPRGEPLLCTVSLSVRDPRSRRRPRSFIYCPACGALLQARRSTRLEIGITFAFPTAVGRRRATRFLMS
jgi:hypothetical protein